MPPDVRTRATMARCVYDGCCTPYETAPVRHAPENVVVIRCQSSQLPPSSDDRQPTTDNLDSHPAALRRPAAVVRDGCHVLDGLDVQTAGGQGADGRFATGARALDLDVDRADSVFLGKLCG